jgi:hypothetical protein
MKRIIDSREIVLVSSLILLSVLLLSCKDKQQSVYDRLMNHVNSIKIINAHEHQRKALDLKQFKIQDYNLFALIAHSYLQADLFSAGSPQMDDSIVNNKNSDELWETYGEYLDYSINTSYYKQFNYGLKKLYDFRASVFTKENTRSLSEEIAENYRDYDTWFNKAFNEAKFEIMILDQYWNPFNCKIDTIHFALAFPINNIVYGITEGPQNDRKSESPEPEYYQLAKKENFTIHTLDDYLAFADHLLHCAMKNKAVCVKNSMAYGRSLDYNDVSYEIANGLFKKGRALSQTDRKALEDFVFHWIIKKCIEYDLPIQIHTGYLAGNGNVLDNGYPVKLNNLFLQYPKARFILFHGGYPWTGEYIALGKMFQNVYLDLVWLPQISKETAIRAFDELLDCVPYNKILWGGDCQLIEESVGSLEIGKEVIIQVLTKRIIEGSMSEQTAIDIINGIFRQNAIHIFNLKEKLNIQ